MFFRGVFFLLTLSCPMLSFSQQEGQGFCEGLKRGNYFPLDIKSKKIVWYETYYYERLIGTKIFNDKTYFEFEQEWKEGQKDYLFLREEDDVVFQYEECCQEETVRFGNKIRKESAWVSISGEFEYKLKSDKQKLKTPYCEYKDLMVIEAKYKNNIFEFYYQRGLGYIGAKENGKLISFIVPEI